MTTPPTPPIPPAPDTPPPPTRRLRLLLVEDSFLVAHSLTRMLGDLGVEVVGPASSVTTALNILREQGCDGAILDVNLGNETVEPVAKALVELKRPLIFITGYSSPALSSTQFETYTRLNKPVDAVTLRHTIQREFIDRP